MSALAVKDLSFSYPLRPVFCHWSATFEPGLTWLEGRNGSGKSTLLKLLAGAIRPERGVVTVAGQSLLGQPLAYRRLVFWCGPDALPLGHLTPAEYMRFIKRLYPALDEALWQRHVAGFALQPHLHALLRELSSGTQRKVWLATALCVGTPVMLLDEPLNALDAASADHFRASLLALARDARQVCIVASHDHLGAAQDFARCLALP